eukprot:7287107-Lingulodinium_polyedra.AAC.1
MRSRKSGGTTRARAEPPSARGSSVLAGVTRVRAGPRGYRRRKPADLSRRTDAQCHRLKARSGCGTETA